MGNDWDFGLLAEFIDERSDRVVHELSVACPCRNGDAFAAFVSLNGKSASLGKINCKNCQGDGFRYRNMRTISGLLTSVNAGPNRQLVTAGYAVAGDCVFSPSFEAGIISDFDRITMLNSVPISEGQVIVRNIGNFKENKELDFHLNDDEDRLWYMPETALHCEDDDGNIYKQNSDFILKDKLIKWVGARPADGVVYTIKYTAFLEYICYSSPFSRFDNNRSLAQKVLLRKKHVFIGTGSSADTPDKRKEEEVVFTKVV